MLYVLDEPTIGLHPRDNDRLLDTLEALSGKGNSLVIVEHDDETMRRADHIVDLGPGPGVHGGEVVAQGTLAEIQANPHSHHRPVPERPDQPPDERRAPPAEELRALARTARARRRTICRTWTCGFPVGRLSVITGISRFGQEQPHALGAAAGGAAGARQNRQDARRRRRSASRRANSTPTWTAFTGAEHLEAVYEVDQSPIGKTSRSTPATYVGVLDEIRALFAQLPLSRIRGYTNGRFSFNNEGGRCESCQGQGVIKHEMSFLPTSYVPCEDCGGLRYNAQTLEVLYNDKSIGQVLQLTIEQAAEFFARGVEDPSAAVAADRDGPGLSAAGPAQPDAQRRRGATHEARHGVDARRRRGAARQAAPARARRNRRSICWRNRRSGLHMADVEQLLKVLHRLVDEGNTVVVIEHHLSVIAEADYLVDIGPEAGEAGGKLVATGTPEQVAKHKVSRIAPFLRELLGANRA